MNTIFITGASSGIGKSIAVNFAKTFSEKKQPINLFITARTDENLQGTKQECEAFGAKVGLINYDLTAPNAAQTVYDACVKTFGSPTCLISNAGVGIFKDFRNITPDDFDTVVNLNLKATFFLAQLAMTDMMKKRSGHLIFITSVAAVTPYIQSSLYCLSKYGQKGLVDVLRFYGRAADVRITNVMPGATMTNMWTNSEVADAKRMLAADDVAKAVVHCHLQPPHADIEELTIRPVKGDIQDEEIPIVLD